MQIKRLTECPELMATLAYWYYNEWGHKNAHRSIEKIEQRLRSGLGDGSFPLYFVAVEDGEPLGSACLKIREMTIHRDKEHWLGDVYVRPDRRRRGIASALVRYAEALAGQLSIAALYLYTPDQKRLYASLGWSTIDHTSYEGEDIVVMEKKLVGAPDSRLP